jgi:hypothetical protein
MPAATPPKTAIMYTETCHLYDVYEHSEKAQAPYTNGPRDVPRCGALSLLKPRTTGGIQQKSLLG